MGVRERHVPRQPLCPVLLPARLSADTDGHCCGPPPGEGTCTSTLPFPLWLCFPEGLWGRSTQCFSPFFNERIRLPIDPYKSGIFNPLEEELQKNYSSVLSQ